MANEFVQILVPAAVVCMGRAGQAHMPNMLHQDGIARVPNAAASLPPPHPSPHSLHVGVGKLEVGANGQHDVVSTGDVGQLTALQYKGIHSAHIGKRSSAASA